MQILFFDTETNGLPKNFRAPMQDVNNWPRVISLSWQVADSDDPDYPHQWNYLIKPNGWVIPKEKFWIDNGFSTEENVLEGVEMDHVLDVFINCLNECELMVAHNINFDYNVLGAELIRYGKRAARKVKQFCTMKAGTNVCKITKGGFGYKWPKLEELFRFLFESEMTGAHDSGSDVNALRLCYFEMVKRNIISYA